MVSINEVCRKLNCHKSFFRNKPHLREIILKAKREVQEKVKSNLPRNGKYEELSDEAKNYEPIFIKYKNEMELEGKNWRIARTQILSEMLKIPYEILIEIKMKYCPYTRKVVKKQIMKDVLKKHTSFKEI